MMAGAKESEERAPADYVLEDPPTSTATAIAPQQYRMDTSLRNSNAIVLDMGSSTLRAGFSSCSHPILQMPPFVARMKDPETGLRTFFVGHEALNGSARSTARAAYDSGLPTSPAHLERLIDGTLVGLGLAEEETISHKFVLTEAPCQPNSARALIMELMFEAYETPALCFGVDALFSYFYNRHKKSENGVVPGSYSRKDALILSFGHNSTHVLPLVNERVDACSVKRVNVGGSDMTDQLTRRLQLLNSDHTSVLTPSRVDFLKNKLCYISQDYNNDLERIKKDTEFYNQVTKTVKVPQPDNGEKPQVSQEEQERAKRARKEHGKRLSEMMREKRRAKKDAEGSGTDDAKNVTYTEEEVSNLYEAMKSLYDLQRIDEMRQIDEDKYYLALLVRKVKSTSALTEEIDKRQLIVEAEKAKLGAAKAKAAEMAWWTKVYEDELLSMSDSELSAPELKRKRLVRQMRGAAEAREKAKKAKEEEKAEAARKAAEIEKEKRENPIQYLTSLRKKRDELAGKIKKRIAAKAAGSDRRSQATRERMRLLAQHAGDKPGFDDGPSGGGKGRGKGKGRGGKGRGRGRGRGRGGRGGKKKVEEEDTFGSKDSDWDVYRSMKVGGNESDSEDNSGEERAELEAVREEILEMAPDEIDPTISRPEGVAWLYEENRYPDEISVTVDRIRTGEVLFQPSLAGIEQCGIIEAIQMSLRSRKFLLDEIFVTGGVSRVTGLMPRLKAELRKNFPAEWGDGIEHALCMAENPIVDAWRGAALFAERGGDDFEQACVTKQEFEEMGNGYLKEHAFGNVFYPTPILSAADLELKKKLQKQASKRGRPKNLLG